MNTLAGIVITGVGATLVMDLWGLARRPLLGIPAPDYGLVGRWLGHMPAGRFRHPRIAAAAPVRGERLLGWTAHYLIGITFAGLLVALVGPDWLQTPSLLPALGVGLVSVLAPFLLMQPGMGAGVAASRTPDPGKARRQSLLTHAVFGLGLYLAASVARLLAAV